MKQTFKFLKYYKKECVFGPLFKLLEASFELFVPLVMASLIDVGIVHKDTGYIVKMCMILVALGLIGFVCSVSAQFFSAKAASGFATKLRAALFSHLQSFSYTEIDTMGTSGMITRMTSDINQTQNGVNMVLRLFLRSPFIVFGAMMMAFTIDVKAALVFAVVIPLLSLVIFGIMAVSIPLYRNVQEKLDALLLVTRENLEGVRVLRAFHKEKEEMDRFCVQNQDLQKLQAYVGKISALLNPLTYVMINAAIAVLIYVGAVQVDIGKLSQGEVVALVNYMSQILIELIKLANLIVTITKAFACAKRISSVFDEKTSMEDGTIEMMEDSLKNIKIEFQNVDLRYKNASEDALEKIDFTASSGETIGIIGGTGSGKTSIVNLLPRFYDATGGNILLNGRNIREYLLSSLRKQIGIVMQKSVLFQGSIRENLRFRKEDATEEEMILALKAAQAYDFVMEKPDGLDFFVEQGGKNLSGGQKQRLSIARALVGNPKILILDDSASALDYATDAALRKSLKNLPYAPVIFIVSQRTSSILHADKILVLEDGKIAGTGKHEELLENCHVYREIYESQYKKEGAVS